MFEGYFSMGGVEIINQHRVTTLLARSDCDPGWLRCQPCVGLNDATGDNLGDHASAPWWDEDDEATHRFYGIYPVAIEGLSDSTREGTTVEGILDGGVVSGYRRAIRQVRVRGLLIAEGEDALEAGMSWLDNALEPNNCSGHGAGCGEVDACWFVECPPEWPQFDSGFPIPEADYEALVDPLWRRMHGVVAISGPLVDQEFKRNDWRARIVEFTIAATTPYVYGVQVALPLGTPQTPSVVADSPVNLIPTPSAEVPYAGTVVVATNYSQNPSLETDSTGWFASGSVITPTPTGARSTELASDGLASYKVTVTTTNSGTNGALYGGYDVTLPTYVAGQRFSVSEWVAAFVISGTASISQTRVTAQWFNGGTPVGSAVTVGTGSTSGGAVSSTGLLRPSGTTILRVVAVADVASWSSGAVLSMYVDALAATLP